MPSETDVIIIDGFECRLAEMGSGAAKSDGPIKLDFHDRYA
jgi:hypothetical protein